MQRISKIKEKKKKKSKTENILIPERYKFLAF